MAQTMLSEFLFVLRSTVYLVSPNETSYANIDEVPSYIHKALCYSPALIVAEIVVLMLSNDRKSRRHSLPTFKDTLCSLCICLLLFLPVLVVRHLELNVYTWFYDNFNVIKLPWNSTLTWLIGFLAVDLGFYFFHRAAHEVNFLWAFHQVHHSSYKFNLLVAFRLHVFNRYFTMLFYLPFALILPPAVFYVHWQFNYIYQFWIHSAVFPSFGILDYVVNNPSLHRVHHGRNRYCLDKNYAAVLSFWDYMFGTLEREKDEPEICYGLVQAIKSYDPVYIQFYYLKRIIQTAYNQDGMCNKFRTFLNGPAWMPGLPRLGDHSDVPECPVDEPEDGEQQRLPLRLKVYLILHCAFSFALLFKTTKTMSENGDKSSAVVYAGFLLWSMISVGMLMEHRRFAYLCDCMRCACYLILEIVLGFFVYADPIVCYTIRLFFVASFWICGFSYFL